MLQGGVPGEEEPAQVLNQRHREVREVRGVLMLRGPVFVPHPFPARVFCSLLHTCRAHGSTEPQGSALGDPEKHRVCINLSDPAHSIT